jgi:hypothetical protein
VVLPLLAQTILLWQVLLAVTLLKKRLGAPQASACGVSVWLASGSFAVDAALLAS